MFLDILYKTGLSEFGIALKAQLKEARDDLEFELLSISIL